MNYGQGGKQTPNGMNHTAMTARGRIKQNRTMQMVIDTSRNFSGDRLCGAHYYGDDSNQKNPTASGGRLSRMEVPRNIPP
mmetsp:Transcript_11212/g.23666  ORF Transcript_11212/g.23666 Transcript_11212/m.23666 type:complete len:80 (+) Transcript_11212:2170-2409(+)